jgi:multiple antibiotic resistance protein
VSGGRDGFCVAVTAEGAGIGAQTGSGTGGSGAHPGGIAMGAIGVHRAASGTAAAGIAVPLGRNGFRIAAGIIILKIGYDMLQARYSNAKLKEDEIKAYANDISITPLSIPMLCGPGAIANGIILMSDASNWTLKATLVGVIGLVYILTYIILRLSTRLVRIMGETGNNVMMRLMGLILMVIAVECFVGGLKPILIDIIQMSRV